MKTSEILTRARKYLSKTELMGICHAVWDSPRPKGCGSDAWNRYQRCTCGMISARLGGPAYAHHWLAAQILKNEDGWDPEAINLHNLQYWVNEQNPRHIQAWRHRWLTMLIKEFKAKGD